MNNHGERTKRLRNDVVSASEIASWTWCPESWRLEQLGAEPMNRADKERGELHHAEKAAFEEHSRSAISLGRLLIIWGGLAALVAMLLLVLR